MLVTALAVVTTFRSTPHHGYYGGGFCPQVGGSLLGRILLVLSTSSFWLDDVILSSPALLSDTVFTSSKSLPIVVGVAFIRLGGVKLVFSTVFPNLTTFLVLPTQLHIWSQNCYPCIGAFAFFLPDFFNAFSSLLILLVSCSKLWFTGFAFLLPFLAAEKSDSSFLSSLNLQQSQV
jgi:hypothetical protein